VGSGLRHTHLTAVAPTRTNSVISGAFSQGIEPIDSNFFVAKQAKGTYVRKNPVLEKLLCDRGVEPEIWDKILDAKGSIQDLDIFTKLEKEIFQTAREIDQFELVKQAADRQQFICQGQSLNLFVDPESDPAYIMRLHLSAWKMGLKSLYYLKSSSLLTKKRSTLAQIVTKADCPWCTRLKELLQTEGISYTEITRERAQAVGIWNEEWKTVPQMWLDGKHIGGYNDYINLKTQSTEKTYVDCLSCEA
jgi:ribonucleoside-diphosphate reductase alpha chain